MLSVSLDHSPPYILRHRLLLKSELAVLFSLASHLVMEVFCHGCPQTEIRG